MSSGKLDFQALGMAPEEAGRLGQIDSAETESEGTFSKDRQLEASPIYLALYKHRFDPSQWNPPVAAPPEEYERFCDDVVAVVQNHRRRGTLYDQAGKLSQPLIDDLTATGYWGQLVPREYGGLGASFRDFAHFLSRLASEEATVAGMASVHQCIGAVNPLSSYGTEEQKRELLPAVAAGLQSGFALTEPGAGSDLTRVESYCVRDGEDLLLYGTKLFITNVYYGRRVAVVCRLSGPDEAVGKDGKPRIRVLMVDLPSSDTPEFMLHKYGLHALKHAHNYGLKFNGLRVPSRNLLEGDGLEIAFRGLNQGRVIVCSLSGGNMRRMLANFPRWSHYRVTMGKPIADRALIHERAGRLAAYIVGCDALVDFCSNLLAQGYRAELECIVAKIFGSEADADAAVNLFMRTHGGRSFLEGHLFGDNIADFFAKMIYEGENEMLAMKFFASLTKPHTVSYVTPVLKKFSAKGAARLVGWGLGELLPYALPRTPDFSDIESGLRGHASFASRSLQRSVLPMTVRMGMLQKKLVDQQWQIRDWSLRIQSSVVMLATALYGNRAADPIVARAADVMCDILRQRIRSQPPSPAFYKKVTKLGQRILQLPDPQNGIEETVFTRGIEPDPILMPYH